MSDNRKDRLWMVDAEGNVWIRAETVWRALTTDPRPGGIGMARTADGRTDEERNMRQ